MFYQASQDCYFENHSEIRAAFPNVSLPANLTDELLTELGIVAISESDLPEAMQQERKRRLIPTQVSPRQIRQALTAAGLRSSVEAVVAGGDQDMKDWWEFSISIERRHPLVVAMATSLGVTERQLDDLFTAAGAL